MSKVEQDLAFLPAIDQARLVRTGEVSPVELVDLYLKRIESLNGSLNAYLTVVGEMAREHARRAAGEIGKRELPPFHGVPISIKDLDDTAGIRTTHGTQSWADRMPDADNHTVSRLKQAGFIILGKTNTPEFGHSVVTEAMGYPPARNPWDTKRSPGGSSGGAAAGLAAGLSAIAQGSDGGGSIRIPSSCCGLFGIKPSRGRVSVAPNPPSLFAHAGPIARTVLDAASLLDVLSGSETGDLFSAPTPDRPFAEEVSASPGRLRIAYTSDSPLDIGEVDPANHEAVESAAKLLASLGHDVENSKPPWDDDPVQGSMLLRVAGFADRTEYPEVSTMEPINQMLYQMANQATLGDYPKMLREIQAWCRPIVGFFDGYDVLVTPTIGIQPPKIGEFANVLAKPDQIARFRSMAMFTMIWNNTGQPAVSVPLYWDEDGLPVGVQIVGRPNDEATLIRLAAQLEEARPWADRRPPI